MNIPVNYRHVTTLEEVNILQKLTERHLNRSSPHCYTVGGKSQRIKPELSEELELTEQVPIELDVPPQFV